jgi:hypothetical protein
MPTLPSPLPPHAARAPNIDASTTARPLREQACQTFRVSSLIESPSSSKWRDEGRSELKSIRQRLHSKPHAASEILASGALA